MVIVTVADMVEGEDMTKETVDSVLLGTGTVAAARLTLPAAGLEDLPGELCDFCFTC